MREDLEGKSTSKLIEWAITEYGDKIALASSFGAEDVVLIDIIIRINPQTKIFTLDTGRLPPETYEVMEKIREKYKVDIEIYFPDTKSVEGMVKNYGPNLFYKSIELRQLCCQIRKVEHLFY